MTLHRLFKTIALLPLVALTACDSPETPQEVTREFWVAVVDNDGETATDLSTLVDEQGFDGYSLDWSGAETGWGRVTVDGDQATIDTVFSGLKALEGEKLDTTTHLVRINDQWLVDYHRTGDEISTDRRLGGLMGSFRELGDSLRSRFADESGKAAREMDRLAQELSAFTDQTRRELSSLIEQYGNELERRLDEFSRSLDDALEQNPDASDEDRQTIDQARKELQQQQEALDADDPDSLAEVSRKLARIQQQISELSGDTFAQLKDELARWSRELNRELEQLNQEARLEHQQSI